MIIITYYYYHYYQTVHQNKISDNYPKKQAARPLTAPINTITDIK